MAGRHKYIIDQGRTWRRWIYLWQDRDKTIPVPMPDFTGKLEIKAIDGGADVVSLTTENGGMTIHPTSGKIEWIASNAQTLPLVGEYSYELFTTNTLGEEASILKGLIEISPQRAD